MAFSRVRSIENVKVLSSNNSVQGLLTTNLTHVYTDKVVYRDVLLGEKKFSLFFHLNINLLMFFFYDTEEEINTNENNEEEIEQENFNYQED